MKFFAVFILTGVCLSTSAVQVRPELAESPSDADTEIALELPLVNLPQGRNNTLTLDLRVPQGTVSNAVLLVFGRDDVCADGVLAPEESYWAVGWDRGQWVTFGNGTTDRTVLTNTGSRLELRVPMWGDGRSVLPEQWTLMNVVLRGEFAETPTVKCVWDKDGTRILLR